MFGEGHRYLKTYGHYIPDGLTLSRLGFSLAVILFIQFGMKDLLILTLIYMIAWVTDILDGIIARKLKIKGKLADWDFYLDIIFMITIFLYFTVILVVPLWFFSVWGIMSVFLVILIRKKFVLAFIGAFAQVGFIFFIYWYNELIFWILAAFWLVIFAIGLISRRFQNRIRWFKEELKLAK